MFVLVMLMGSMLRITLIQVRGRRNLRVFVFNSVVHCYGLIDAGWGYRRASLQSIA
jgi:Ni/Fe-hydrogenase subunit HybB-like protein